MTPASLANQESAGVSETQVQPNFLIIGAPKAGTTSLWALLRQHPQIYMPDNKEPAFFSYDDVYTNGWRWYCSLFEKADGHRAIGEATPNYATVDIYSQCPRRIFHHLPNVKLIYIVRHPLRRIESAWKQMLHTRHPVPRDFSEAVLKYERIVAETRYWHNLEVYRRQFPDEQILLLFFEDFVESPEAVIRQCFHFLGVDAGFVPADVRERRNSGAEKEMDTSASAMLRRVDTVVSLWRQVPMPVRRLFRPLVRRKVPSRPKWSRSAYEYVLEQLEPDIRSILWYGNKTSDYWDVSEQSLQPALGRD